MKYIIIILFVVCSGCYYIHQDWSMYDEQRQNKLSTVDAGTDR